MKPEFALSLSFDGICLLLRGANGWLRVGEVSLHVSDLKAELADLRRAAEGLAPGGFTTKLIIPDEQIGYFDFDTGEVDDTLRARIIRDSLDGATPYQVDDLVYDHVVDGPTTRVAAVARETLEEAEAFAVEHGFRPVCFVASPQSARFDAEIHFGETRIAETLLPPGDRPEPDDRKVEIVGNAPPPPAEIEARQNAAPGDEAQTESRQDGTSGPTEPEHALDRLPAPGPAAATADAATGAADAESGQAEEPAMPEAETARSAPPPASPEAGSDETGSETEPAATADAPADPPRFRSVRARREPSLRA
ncbi:MAG: hypothetical protein ACLFRU_07450, partial [Paracoccaceae bacterium]